MNCPNLQKSLGWCEGKTALPGIRRRLYYLSKSLILKWPERDKDTAGRLKSANLKGDFTLAADTKWKYIDVLVNKSGLTSEPQGEQPSQTQLNKLVAVHPGTGAEASAASAYINNDDTAALIQDMEGNWRLLGSELYQGKGTVNQDLGQGPTGTASTTINLEATDLTPAPFYKGKIETEDGDFMADGSDIPDDSESGDNP